MGGLEGASDDVPVDAEFGISFNDTTFRAGLKEASVVASKEPSELVAFVSLREGVNGVTVENLKAHCQANLTSSYVPKFYVIMPELPKLPNGKPNLSALKDLATEHVSEEGETVMDSLGQMKKLSKWAIFENAVIHRCYAFWMIGVMSDHYMRCAIDMNVAQDVYYPFCTILARGKVKPWTEILVRSFFGNDQDMFGFIMLGAYQDSRPAKPGGPPRVNLGLKDLFIFVVYMLMALPFPQLMHYVFGGWAWPVYWGGDPPPSNLWNWDYMRVNSDTSDHRWYLLMVLQARIFMQIMETLRAPGWVQCLMCLLPCVLPDAAFEGKQYAFDVCENNAAPEYVLYTFSWIFRNFGDGCAMYWRWVQWYVLFYVMSFHYLRPFVNFGSKYLPSSRTWAAVAFGCSMMIGMLMAMFHYPNNVLENGTHLEWVWLELGVDMIQPALVVLGMSQLPFNMAWWGNTTLGCYVFHFYFKDQMGLWAIAIVDALTWDPTGLLVFFVVIGMIMLFTSLAGPCFHYLLLTCAYSPNYVHKAGKRFMARRQQAREARPRVDQCTA